MRKTLSNLIFNFLFFLITISSFAQQATEESNAILLKQIEESNKRLENLRIEDSLLNIQREQSGDINSAISESPSEQVRNNEYGALGPNYNVDPSTVVKGADAADVNRSGISKLLDSIPPVILYMFWGLFAIVTIKFLFEKKE